MSGIKPLLSIDENPRQHELTTLLDAVLVRRDGFASLFARAGDIWTHNQFFKRRVRNIEIGRDETIVGAKFCRKREVTAVVALTGMQDGFPTSESRVFLRETGTRISDHMSLQDYFRHGSMRSYLFHSFLPPTLKR